MALCVTGTEGFCDKNADPFDGDLLRLMSGEMGTSGTPMKTSPVKGIAADFTRALFAQPASAHRSISFKVCGGM